MEIDASYQVGQVQLGEFRKLKLQLVRVDHAGEIHVSHVNIVHAHVHIHIAHVGHIEGVGKPFGHIVLVEGEHILQGVLVDTEQGFHIEIALAAFLAEGLVGKDVGVGIRQLVLHDLACGGFLRHVAGQGGRVGDAGLQEQAAGVLGGLDNAHNGDILAVFHEASHVGVIIRLVPPDVVPAVVFIIIRAAYKLKGDAQNVVVIVDAHILRDVDILFVNKLLDHVVQLHRIAKAQGIEHKVADAAARSQHQDALVIIFRPPPGLYVVLGDVEVLVVRHLVEDVRPHHGGHHAAGAHGGAKAQGREGIVRVHLTDAVRSLQAVDLGLHVVGVFHGAGVLLDAAFAAVQVGLQGLQIVGIHGGKHVRHHLDDVDLAFFCIVSGCGLRQHGRKVEAGALDLQGVFGEGVVLHVLDIVVHAAGEGQDQGDADDADGSGKGGQDRPGLFRLQVVEA